MQTQKMTLSMSRYSTASPTPQHSQETLRRATVEQ